MFRGRVSFPLHAALELVTATALIAVPFTIGLSLAGAFVTREARNGTHAVLAFMLTLPLPWLAGVIAFERGAWWPIVIPEADAGAWTRTIEEVLGDRSLRNDLSARGRRRALATYYWPVVARQHSQFFQQLIEGGMS